MSEHSAVSVDLTVPRLVQLLGIVALLLSLGQLLSAVLAFVVVGFVIPGAALEWSLLALPDVDARAVGFARWIIAHLREYMAASVLLSLVNVVAAIGLLGRRRWACNYFMVWACFIAAAAAFGIYLLYAQRLDFAPAPSDVVAHAAAIAGRLASVLADGSAVAPLLVILGSLLVIALLSSTGAAVRPASSARAALFNPDRAPAKSAVAFGVAGLALPGCGLVAVVLGFIAWTLVQNDERSTRRKAAILAMLLGAYGCARDGYALYRRFAP